MKGTHLRKTVAGLAAAAVAGGVLAGAAVAAEPDDYLYRLDAVSSTAAVPVASFANRIHYTTAGGSDRTVKIAVRVPPGASQRPLPVVIIAHGGGEQPNERNPETTLPEWGEAIARAGYLAINVLHGTNVGADRAALCNAIGYPVPANSVEIAQTLQEIAAAFVDVLMNGGTIDLAAILQAHPTIYAQYESLLGQGDESTPVSQVVTGLMGQLQACDSINGLGHQDRPQDIAAVVNALHDGVLPELEGWMDLTRVALLGHSNGTSSILNAIGAQRALPNGVKIEVPFPDGDPRRPVAAVALSPMGINTYGYFDTAAWAPGMTDSKQHSWVGLTNVPVLTITSDGDNHCKSRFVCADSDSAGKRRIPFERMPGGDKYLMFVADTALAEIVSSHELLGSLDGPGTCRSAALASECASVVKWVKSTAIAFLDAHVLGEVKAKSWMKGRKLAKASAGVATIERK